MTNEFNNDPNKDHGRFKDFEKRVEHSVEDAVKRGVNEVVRDIESAPKNIKKFWHVLGPGLTTGASDDDPSGITTYSQTGARFGFGLTWLALFTFPLMSTVQEMCARIGIVTGQGLAANIRTHYSKKALYFSTLLLILANIFNIGANLGAMAKGFQLIFPGISFALLVIFFGITSLALQVYTPYEKYARYLKYLALILLSYVVTAFLVDIDWGVVLKSLVVPSVQFSKDYFIMLCAILGTTISPYLFFWQTSQEVEEKILHNHVLETPEEMDEEIKDMRVDVWSGMFLSNLVMFFIIIVCAATLNASGITNIDDASQAAAALRPLAGHFAFVLFAFGIIGTGMLAIPVLAGSAAYAVSESFGWRFGLYRKLKEAYAFYGVIALSVAVGILLNFVGLDPIKALIYSAVANGIVAPVVLFFIVSMSSKEAIMGKHKNKNLSKWVGWGTVVLMSLAAVGAIISIF